MAPKSEKETKASRARSESESSSSAESNSKAEESSSSGSGSESESSSDNESVASSDEKSKSQNASSDQKVSQARAFRTPQAYKPPFGFKSAKNNSSQPESTSALSSLDGKQIFHITAPAFVPLSKVKEVSLAAALKGEPILEHKGVRYGIPEYSLQQAAASSGANGQTLFVYDSKAQNYTGTVTNVPTYHIQEMIQVPGGKEFEEASVMAAKALEKPPRKQPKHLKMRFRPVGSGDAPPETLGESSDEEDEELTKPSRSSEKEKEKKRKHQQTEGDAAQAAGLPRKKSKKHSADTEGGDEKSKKSKDRDGKKRKKEKA
ncbi:DNA-directed RNA polymerase I subunit RPA34.5-domain-containing protein [Aspergillus unguis]